MWIDCVILLVISCVVANNARKCHQMSNVDGLPSSIIIVTFFLICYLLIQSAAPVINLRIRASSNHEKMSLYFTNFLVLLLLAIVLWQSNVGKIPKKIKDHPNKLAFSAIIEIADFAKAFLITLLAAHSWEGILLKFGVSAVKQGAVAQLECAENWSEFTYLATIAIICAPIIEELLFRGLLYRTLKFRSNATLAALTTSIVFSVLHCNLFSLVPLFVFSMCLITIYENSGNIQNPILIHSLFNFVAVAEIVWQKIHTLKI